MTTLRIPALSLVVLVGPSGAGKSTFAARHFRTSEILSSDRFRGWVSDDESALDASGDAFEVLHLVARKRLARGLLTVVDATNVQKEARAPLVALAREHHVLPVAIALDLPERLCHERNEARPDRGFGPHVVRNQIRNLRQSLRGLSREGFRHVHVLETPEAVDAVTIERERLWNDRRDERGPFDVIGDVHGCFEELRALLAKLGYVVARTDGDVPRFRVTPPAGRKAVFLGDLVDRGPGVVETLSLVMDMVAEGAALCVPGNHETKLLRKLRGRDVRLTHGLAESMAQLERQPDAFRERVAAFIDDLVSHYVLDEGRLVVAHAGLPAEMQGRGSGKVRNFALYGETTGETDEYGLPVRYPWAQDYRGQAIVVYGHTPVVEPEWLNRTICIDTGCVYGGRLTALRYPEKELVSVAAQAVHYASVKPAVAIAAEAPALSAQQREDDLLDLEDVTGKRTVQTRLMSAVTVRPENAAAALEVMSRFAANPKWLVHLPPTMSPGETSRTGDLLEHPAEVFGYFRGEGVPRVVCQEKHMGSRAIVVLCRDEEVARRRFGVTGEGIGICYTRTGRRFFADAATEQDLLARVARACTAAGLWAELETDWICLDAELMPWSAKAQALLREQYAPVGAAGVASLAAAREAVDQACQRAGERGSETGRDLAALQASLAARQDALSRYVDAYSRYCWDVASVDDLRLAPFHVLASEGRVHVGKDHLWHMAIAQRLAGTGDRLLHPTRMEVVDLADPESERRAIAWWESLTAAGGEGMVVKPVDFLARGPRGLVQPALKCRGPEYLRIIYGPEYRLPENLERLRGRSVGAKRALARRELALGVESLERFVRKEPLRRVHECVFAVLALESDPVDPRL
jgi:polynucleotide kinase-phosphatase